MEISMPAPEVNLWLPGIGVPRVNDLQLESSTIVQFDLVRR